METKKKKIIYRILSLICLIVAIIAVVDLVRYYQVRKRADDIYESLQLQNTVAESSQTTEPETVTEPESPSETSTEESTVALPEDELMLREIDFKQLTEEVCSDIYAWIYIPDTNIDYPMLQHPTDNSYYLTHNLDGSEGYPGCIYTELENAKDFSDFNTIIYGHNMKNGTMFHDLRSYVDAEFLEEHPYIYIYMPDRVLKYEIFATYQTDNRHLLYAYDYSTKYGRQQYLKEVLEQRNMTALINEDVSVDSDSKIITLSTCVHATGPDRYLVQGVLTEDYRFISAD